MPKNLVLNDKRINFYQEKIHISFFEACFLIPMSLFVMYVCISLNKIVFKPKESIFNITLIHKIVYCGYLLESTQ